jgi:hypothetical protein
MIISPCEALAIEFVDLSVEREKLYRSGDVRGANRLFDKCSKVAKKLMAFRDERDFILRQLAQDDREEVALIAACYLLPIDEPFAYSILRRIDETGKYPENRISAHMSMKEWSAGRMEDIRSLA